MSSRAYVQQSIRNLHAFIHWSQASQYSSELIQPLYLNGHPEDCVTFKSSKVLLNPFQSLTQSQPPCVCMTSAWVPPSEAVADPAAPQLRQERALLTSPKEMLRSSTLTNFQLLINAKSRWTAKTQDPEMNLIFKVPEDYSDTDIHCNMTTLNVTRSKTDGHFDNSKRRGRKPVPLTGSSLQLFVYSCMDSISYCCFLFYSSTVLLSKQVISLSLINVIPFPARHTWNIFGANSSTVLTVAIHKTNGLPMRRKYSGLEEVACPFATLPERVLSLGDPSIFQFGD